MSEQIGVAAVPSVEPKVLHKFLVNTEDAKASVSVVDPNLAQDLALLFVQFGLSYEYRVVESC